ncbi:MAG: bifunctional demethylmenaquinone methyltransferase/2-methoxy-6-polyprenyl-1,4-benzoquinol methylase UbiE [Pseudomonadales bacterium]|nr:bifunctional demethylmenaquinone methyltransferase/2-methoxy-6-polyprenyl-1,4-benzoquinol methylase UbiE [Pseudomonadales bacterium]
MSERLIPTAEEPVAHESGSTTHFGYEDVAKEEKVERVAEVFHSVAARYDIMNDLMSFGVHRIWKALTIEMSGVREGHRILDVAGGTGDLTKKFSKLVGNTGQVILADINSSMLEVGRERLTDQGYVSNVQYCQANAEELPFEDNSFDCVSIAFGLRNVTDKDKALRAMTRVLKPGGRLLILEFSKPTNTVFEKVYDRYSFSILPKLGKLISNDADSYQYLSESIRMHPDQNTLQGMMEQAGLKRCRFNNMTGGVVALHSGIKP